MSEKKVLNQEELEKVTGGGNEYDTSFDHVITEAELPSLAKGTEILVSYSGTSQCVGPFKSYMYMQPGNSNSLYIEWKVTRGTPDFALAINVPAGVQFNTVTVYRKS